MNMLANILKKSFCLSGIMLVIVASAVDIPDGGSLTIDDSASSGGANIVCQGSATLTVAVSKSGGLYQVKNLISAMEGTVTVDLSACADAPVLFTKDFRANNSGRVIFTGGTKVLLGSATSAVLEDSVVLPPKYGFAALEGPAGFSVTFTNAALLAVAMPANVVWSVAPDANILVVPENGLSSILGSGNEISLTDFDVNMLAVNVFPETATVTVPAGRTLSLKPMAFNTSTWAISSVGSPQFKQNFALDDASSTLMCRSSTAAQLHGVISGAGRLRLYETVAGNTILYGKCTFTGPIVLDSNNSDPYSLELNGAAALGGGNEIMIYGSNTIDIRGSQTLAHVTGAAEKSRIRLCSNASVTINGIAGIVTAEKYAAAVTGASASLAGADAGAVFCHEEGTMPVEIKSSISVPRVDIRRVSATGKSTICHVFGEDKAGLLPKWEEDDALDIQANAGTSIDVPISQNEVTLAVACGASAKVGRISVDIASAASFWLDASVAASVVAVTNASGAVVFADDAGHPYVQEWLDRRSGRSSPFLFNYRCYGNSATSTAKGEWVDVPVTQPIYGSDMLNGLAVMDLSTGSRRLLSACNGQYSVLTDVKFCVMVFGSSAGGGKALLATSDGTFARGMSTASGDYKAADPITTNGAVGVWLNGLKVDPSKTGLSGDWDIVSVDTSPMKLNGLGYGGKGISDAPGRAKYAEVVFFSRVLTNAERISVERYLAKKWGLADKYTEDLGRVVLSGCGTVELSGTIPLSGGFGGNLRMSDDAEIVCGTNLPPTDEAIAAIPGRVRWIDPNDEATVTFSKRQGRSREVTVVSDRTGDKRSRLIANATEQVYPNAIRAPWLNHSARGVGPVRNWLDYSNIYTYETGENEVGGNYLKFSTDGAESGVEAIGIQTAFIISDSARGGGTPLLDTTVGSLIINRPAGASASDPIWPSGTDVKVTGGTTYLNGEPVNGSVSGFTGAPELFAFETTATIGICNFGSFRTSEKTFGESVGELLGEAIFFDKVLDDVSRRRVEAYLMWKWLCRLPEGYDNFAAATVSGSGRIASASLVGLPTLAEGYAGMIAVTGNTLDFGFSSADSAVRGALIVPAATLELANDVTVNVHVDGRRIRGGKYVLIDVNSIKGSPVFHLNLIGDLSEAMAESVSLVVEGGRVVLVRDPPGSVLVVR